MNLVSDFYRERESLRRRVRALASQPGARGLDVGCRHGDVSRSLAETLGFLAALDIARYPEWAAPSANLAFLNASAMAIPFPDATFDVVVSSECLQYVPDPEVAVDELARVLKPGGKLVLSFPEGSAANTYLDPYNLAYGLLRRLRVTRLGDEPFVRHLRVARILRRAARTLDCEVQRRSGTLLFIYLAVLIDHVQGVRTVLGRRRGLVARALRAGVTPIVRLLMLAINLDNAWSPPALWYNNVLCFRKR